MRAIRTEIDIAAPAARVWDILAATDQWGEWNPFATMQGRLAVGERIEVQLTPPGLGGRPPIAEIDAWVADELERLHPDRLALSDAPERDIRDEADRVYRSVIGIEA